MDLIDWQKIWLGEAATKSGELLDAKMDFAIEVTHKIRATPNIHIHLYPYLHCALATPKDIAGRGA